MSQYPQYTVPEGFINLGVGQPAPKMLPLQAVREAVSHRFAQDDPCLLQYGDIPGIYSPLLFSFFLFFLFGLVCFLFVFLFVLVLIGFVGYRSFREALAKFLDGQAEYKGPIDPNSLFVTNGITGGLLLICTFFTQAGYCLLFISFYFIIYTEFIYLLLFF